MCEVPLSFTIYLQAYSHNFLLKCLPYLSIYL
nr:MAG TPA: hypothetical protein [Caudoviricetes sp.]DAT27417.1 MAG TPA: hypothetical protein [Caudoviricetes sp.]